MSNGNGVDKVAEFHKRWDALAEATALQHPAVEEWLFAEAKGVLVHSSCDPDTAESGRIEWIA